MARSARPPPGCTRITPSAPTPNRRSHRARTSSGLERWGVAHVHQDQEVVAGTVVLGQVERSVLWCRLTHGAGEQSPTPAPSRGISRKRAATAATGSASGSTHTIRGSRRNQAICRRAKARVRRTAWSTASATGMPSSTWAEQLAVAEGLAGRPRQAAGPGGQGADLVQESEVHQPVEPLGDAPVEVGRIGGGSRSARPGSAGSARGPDRSRRTGARLPWSPRGPAPGGAGWTGRSGRRPPGRAGQPVVEGGEGPVLPGAPLRARRRRAHARVTTATSG